MFKKILIANRGEIACRIQRTAQLLGVKTVGVYSDADRDALHRQIMDEAVYIGASPARESYLLQERIIEAAKKTGAEAIHPGYGFLSENAAFAEEVVRAGLVFIGPDAHSIKAMGSKSAAKSLMQKAGVPVVPGYHGDAQDDALFLKKAEEIGFPVLIKAVMGGGGKGMRRVDRAEDLPAAIAAARREALSSFGDQSILIEKYLQKPRHIEMQIFGDRFGETVHLFERDCSLQRRHQKVIEEAPAPGFTEEARMKLAKSAIAAAKAVQYVGAGTVEFIAEADNLEECYFMEMNTRLQVEHPVTEMVTGLDLVEWQLRIAAGEKLPKSQNELTLNGHAIELRICAEDPARDYIPSIGKIQYFHAPKGDGVRCDAGIAQQGEVSPFYDSMIAKLIVHSRDRKGAIQKAQQALAATHLAGIVTNLDLLRHLLGQNDFAKGRVDTGFIPAHPYQPDMKLPPFFGAIIAAAEWKHAIEQYTDKDNSPWAKGDGWRSQGVEPACFWLKDGEGKSHRAALSLLPEGRMAVAIEGEHFVFSNLQYSAASSYVEFTYGGKQESAWLTIHGKRRWLNWRGHRYLIDMLGALPGIAKKNHQSKELSGQVTAPMPGKIIQLLVKPGEEIVQGQTLLLLEAMKMEHRLTAPIAGKVDKIKVAINEQVNEGVALMEIVSS